MTGATPLVELFSTYMRIAARTADPVQGQLHDLGTIFDDLGLWRWDVATDLVSTTTCCRKLLCLGAESDVSRDCFVSALHGSAGSVLRRALDRTALNGTPFSIEHRVAQPNEQARWLAIEGHAEKDPSGRPIGIAGVVVDVTDWKSEQLAYEQQKLQLTHLSRVAILGELSGALAHELNQPLTAILSNTQAAQLMLMQQPLDLAELKQILEDIVASDKRAGAVIHRMRALLKRDRTRYQRLSIDEVAAEVIELSRSELITHRVILLAELASNLPPVRGDRIQLQQVLLNLVINACEEMLKVPPAARTLRIATSPSPDGGVEVTISDSGPGISDEVAHRLFEAFFTTKHHGLGLGLSISKAIVSAHGGQIRVLAPDRGGATFIVRLPAEEVVR
ncbi:MAG: ATP-binding protein [Alphaproteobacteria bacterium]